jgi:hypothetical protein
MSLPAYDAMKDEATQLNSIWDVVDDGERECLMDMPPVTVELQRGQCMFIHPMTLYATHGNRSYSSSRSVYIHYMAHGTQTVQAGPLLPKTTRFPPAAVIQGPYFPMVFDPSMVEDMIPPSAGALPAGGSS